MDERLETISIRETDTIRTAMDSIERSGCEIALVVDESRRLLGTLSDGDIRRALLAGAQLDDDVEPHFHTRPFTVGAEASRAEVLDLMRSQWISQVPVIDAGRHLVGIHLMTEVLGATERPNWVLILAGGRGTRLAPITEQVPKPMVKVAGRPILERLVLHLVGNGIRSIALSVNHLADQIIDHFGDGERFGCTIRYVREDRPLGTGGPLRLLADTEAVRAPIVVMNGDLVTQFSLADLLATHTSTGAVATVATRRYSHTVPFGVVEDDGCGRVRAIVEKPVAEWPINAGIYVLDPPLVARVPADEEFPITALLSECIRRDELVATWALAGEWFDVGRFSDLRQARGEG